MRAWLVVCTVAIAACGGGGGSEAVPAPVLATQPQAVTLNDGGTATFSAAATGSGLTYEWRKNGVPIAGATGTSYTTQPLTLADTGALYTVVVSNSGGSVASQGARVTVLPVAPSIDVQPASLGVDDGAEATFAVHVVGSSPLSYQWLRNGQPVLGANASALVLSPAVLADNGATFSVQVTNAVGSIASTVATLTVAAVPPRIDAAPQPASVVDGDVAVFSVTAHGSAPLAYQWSVNGQPVTGATDASYQRAASYADNGSLVSVTVSSAYGTATSTGVKLTVDPRAAVFTREPQSVAMSTGGTASFTVNANGTAPMSYQWQRSLDGGTTWTDLPGSNSTTYAVPGATLAWTGTSLRVLVTNPAGTVASEVVSLTVSPGTHVIAGALGGNGYANGSGPAARLQGLADSAMDADGNLYVPDTLDGVIRKVTPAGAVSTYAGRFGFHSAVDGPAGQAAFSYPTHVAAGPGGELYVADLWTLRKVATDGSVSTVAGAVYGTSDGTGTAASFASIGAMTVDPSGTVWLADGGTLSRVRKVTADGVVTSVAGGPSAGWGEGVDGPAADARFAWISGIARDAAGNLFVVDSSCIRKVAVDGTVSTYVGQCANGGYVDGPRQSALLGNPQGLALDAAGNLYIGELADIRRVSPTGYVETLAGGANGKMLAIDGTGAQAMLVGVSGLSISRDGSRLAFVDTGNAVVRTMTPNGAVKTLAGLAANRQVLDGTGDQARFYALSGLTADADGTVYVADGNAVRRVSPSGQVSSLALKVWTDIANAAGVAVDRSGNVYVVDAGLHQVLKVTPAGAVHVLAGQRGVMGAADGPGAQASFFAPSAIAIDASGVLYVADTGNHAIRKILADGSVSTLAGMATADGSCDNRDGVGKEARFCQPVAIAVGPDGLVYVADSQTQTVRRITPDGTVSTYAGVAFSSGFGAGHVPRFTNPGGIALDGQGNLYVADTGNQVIQLIRPDGTGSAVIGQVGAQVLAPGGNGPINSPRAIAVLPNGRLVFASEQALVGD